MRARLIARQAIRPGHPARVMTCSDRRLPGVPAALRARGGRRRRRPALPRVRRRRARVRILGAKLPDTLGPMQAGSISMAPRPSASAWSRSRSADVPGLIVGLVLIAVGSSFLYPSLLLLALHGVPEEERGSVVGTFSAFFDFAGGMSGVVSACSPRSRATAAAFAMVAGVVSSARCSCCARASARAHYTGDARPPRRRRPAPTTRTRGSPGPGNRHDVAARHQRLPAEDRRHPVVPLRAVAPAPADDTVVYTTRHDGDAAWDARAGVPRRARRPGAAATPVAHPHRRRARRATSARR